MRKNHSDHDSDPAAGRRGAAVAAWRRWPLWRHAAALGLLLTAVAVRYAPAVFAAGPLDDEAIYLQAFELVAAGRSPYETSFYYPAVIAHAGARLHGWIGDGGVLAAMRGANLLGLAAATWIALAWWPASWGRRLAVGALYLALAPAVRLGVLWGNLSLLVAGMVLAALVAWPRWPLLAGAALGLSVAVKPLAPAALVALGAHRPAGGGRRHLVAAIAAAVTLGALLLLAGDLGGWLGQSDRAAIASRNVSLYRLLFCFGIAPPPWMLAALVAGGAAALAAGRRFSPTALVVLAVTAAVLATPLVWSHTLLLTLPVQAMALDAAHARLGTGDAAGRRHRRYAFSLVALLVLAIQLCEGVGGIDDQALWLMGLVTAVPALAPALLAAYVLRGNLARRPP